MSRFANAFVKGVQQCLPSPLTIAFLLSGFTILLALVFTTPKGEGAYLLELLSYWEGGFFNFLAFAMQKIKT